MSFFFIPLLREYFRFTEESGDERNRQTFLQNFFKGKFIFESMRLFLKVHVNRIPFQSPDLPLCCALLFLPALSATLSSFSLLSCVFCAGLDPKVLTFFSVFLKSSVVAIRYLFGELRNREKGEKGRPCWEKKTKTGTERKR